MSRIGRLPISIPSSVSIDVDGQHVKVTGPKGNLDLNIAEPLSAAVDDGTLVVSRPNDERRTRALHGLTRTLLNNMVIGVTEGYSKQMLITGTGYRVTAKGSDLEFALGYSHPVLVKAPAGISFGVETPTKFTISGIDKQQVGEVAAKIRKIRKLDPYKGKGVRYADETIRRKAGKAGK